MMHRQPSGPGRATPTRGCVKAVGALRAVRPCRADSPALLPWAPEPRGWIARPSRVREVATVTEHVLVTYGTRNGRDGLQGRWRRCSMPMRSSGPVRTTTRAEAPGSTTVSSSRRPRRRGAGPGPAGCVRRRAPGDRGRLGGRAGRCPRPLPRHRLTPVGAMVTGHGRRRWGGVVERRSADRLPPSAVVEGAGPARQAHPHPADVVAMGLHPHHGRVQTGGGRLLPVGQRTAPQPAGWPWGADCSCSAWA